jgi:hypothetical protein
MTLVRKGLQVGLIVLCSPIFKPNDVVGVCREVHAADVFSVLLTAWLRVCVISVGASRPSTRAAHGINVVAILVGWVVPWNAGFAQRMTRQVRLTEPTPRTIVAARCC